MYFLKHQQPSTAASAVSSIHRSICTLHKLVPCEGATAQGATRCHTLLVVQYPPSATQVMWSAWRSAGVSSLALAVSTVIATSSIPCSTARYMTDETDELHQALLKNPRAKHDPVQGFQYHSEHGIKDKVTLLAYIKSQPDGVRSNEIKDGYE